MNDKELLELAALVAGVAGTYRSLDSDFEGEFSEGISEYYGYKWWNPLTDDGDAFRLAVNLDMQVKSFPVGARVLYQNNILDTCEVEVINSDKHAATRRAIVRAAAEIGKSMKVD